MEKITVSKGTTIFLGAPSSPLPKTIIDLLKNLLASLPGVLEGHLPQCYIQESMEKPAQVLVVVLKKGMEQNIMDEINIKLPRLLPQGMHIDLWPLQPNHYLLPTIREAKCVLKEPLVQKKWWHKF